MRSKLQNGLLFAAQVLFLLVPAFYNHYPIVNPDTAVYIESGFLPEMPSDRPITYGLLIRALTLNGLSLWLLIAAQAAMVAWLISRIIKRLTGARNNKLFGLVIIAILSLCTPLSWVVSQVQPDIFTGIAILCLAVLLIGEESRKTMNLLYVCFFLSVAVHLSHPVLFAVIIILLFLARKVYSENSDGTSLRKMALLFALSAGSIVLMLTPLHKSKHIFLVGSLLEKGVLKPYLDDNCASHKYSLCTYKDSLPADVNQFWWDPNSPLYKIGDWKSLKPEFDDITHHIFFTPKYLRLYLLSSMRQAAKQSVTYNIGDGNQSFSKGSYVNRTISKYFPREIHQFDNAVQNNALLDSKAVATNRWFNIFLIACLPPLLYMLFKWRTLSRQLKTVVVVCLSGTVLNIADFALFGILNGRYACKVIWLLPFCVLMYILHKYTVPKKGIDHHFLLAKKESNVD